METAVEEKVKCSCGVELVVMFASCGYINCPGCGILMKVGACE